MLRIHTWAPDHRRQSRYLETSHPFFQCLVFQYFSPLVVIEIQKLTLHQWQVFSPCHNMLVFNFQVYTIIVQEKWNPFLSRECQKPCRSMYYIVCSKSSCCNNIIYSCMTQHGDFIVYSAYMRITAYLHMYMKHHCAKPSARCTNYSQEYELLL